MPRASDELFIGAYWRARPLTLREFADSARAFLIRLQTIDSGFSELHARGDRVSADVALHSDLSNLEDLIFRTGWSRDYRFDKPGPEGKPSWESKSENGFHLSFLGVPKGPSGSLFVGGTFDRVPNNALLEFPMRNYSYAQARQIILLLVTHWTPSSALVTTREFSNAVDFPHGTPEANKSNRIGWITFFSGPLSSDVIPVGVEAENIENQGTLLTVTREPIDPRKDEHRNRAIQIRDNLYKAGIVKKL